MRKFLCFVSCVVLLLMASCHDTADDVLLHHLSLIEQRGDTVPEQALGELVEIKRDVDKCSSEYVRNKYLMLKTRLCDKANMIPTSPDTIDQVVEYFMEHGSDEERMEALYYQASVYRDLKDYPRAITSFCRVLDYVDEEHVEPSRLLQNTYSQLASLYCKQNIYSEGVKVAKKGCTMAERSHTLDPIYLMDVASAAMMNGDSIEGLEYCRRTYEFIKRDSAQMYPDVICELLMRFIVADMREEAEDCYDMVQRIDSNRRPFNYLRAMTYYNERFVSPDSAVPYHEQVVLVSPIYGLKLASARWLMLYYIEKKSYSQAAKYAILYAKYSDATKLEYQYEQTSRACGEHLYAVSLQKEVQALEMSARYRKLVYALVVTLLLVALVLSAIYSLQKRHYIKLLLQKDKAISTVKEAIEQYDKRLEESAALVSIQREKLYSSRVELEQIECEMHAKLAEKEKIISEQEESLCAMNETIAANEANIQAKQKQISELVRRSLLERASVDSGDVVKRFVESSYGKITIQEDDWNTLYAAVENMYPGFSESVMSIPRITELNLKTAYLLKIGMSNPQIANLTDCSRQTVWDRVKKIKACMGDWLVIPNP